MSSTYRLFVNGHEYVVAEQIITGAQVRAIGGIDDAVDLVFEGPGSMPDQVLADDLVIDLAEGPPYIFVRAQTAFG